MASKPPGRCCSIGVKHEGEAQGQIIKIGNTETYVAYPENKQTANAILVLTDVLGHKLINSQLIADQFAANGYFAVVPDLFEGDAIPLQSFGTAGFDLMAWLTKGGPSGGHLPPQTDPIVEGVIKELRASHGVRKLGAVGYCFGAKYVARFGAAGKGIDVGAMAHPSFVDADELKAIVGPLTIAAAEKDHIFPAEKRHESEEILKDMSIPYSMTLYSDVEHGFAVRGDMSNKSVKYAKEAAFYQFVQWFDEYLSGDRASSS